MKKFHNVFITLVFTLLGACSGNTSNDNTFLSLDTLPQVEDNTPISLDTNALKEKVASEIMSYGAIGAYFDDNNYFVYCVNKSSISTSANEVAKAMYPMVVEVPNVKGCIVVDAQTKKELGRYEAR